jgi:peptidoglycan/LPS O-acetylase OafA/YrhL
MNFRNSLYSAKNSYPKIPGLNELRGIAALVVLIGHVYEIAGHYEGLGWASKIHGNYLFGDDMVNLFFVISGFIISILLLKERNESGINISNFYKKRILRIWPLYFGLLFIVISIGNFSRIYSHFGTLAPNAILEISLFLVNFNILFQVILTVLPHYWSLSVEEQFYMFWPFIIKFLKLKWFVLSCVMIIFLFIITRNLFAYKSTNEEGIYGQWNNILFITRFSVMAIGGLGAVMYLYYRNYVDLILKHNSLRFFILVLFFTSIIYKVYIPYINFEVKGFLYMIVILIVTTKGADKIGFENRVLDHLGMISYGLYLYHWPIIPIIIYFSIELGCWGALCSFGLLPLVGLSILTTYLISYFSFVYFESFFLRFKPKLRVA